MEGASAAEDVIDELEDPPPEGWLEFELGVDLDQCKSMVPDTDTAIDHPMITGPNISLTMEHANEFCEEELEAAVTDFAETYDKVSNVEKFTLADGYLFTAQNEPEIGGTNYWVKCRRTVNGKAYAIESTCATKEQQANAVIFAKRVRAPRDDELLCPARWTLFKPRRSKRR